MTRRTFCIPKIAHPLPEEGYVIINRAVWSIEEVRVQEDESWYTVTGINPQHLPWDARPLELPLPIGEVVAIDIADWENAQRS